MCNAAVIKTFLKKRASERRNEYKYVLDIKAYWVIMSRTNNNIKCTEKKNLLSLIELDYN